MLTRRDMASAAIMGAGALSAAGAAAAAPGTSGARIEGPVSGGRGRIYGGHFGDLGFHGYVEGEYFVSGQARSYRPLGDLTLDGRWKVAPDRTALFRTRVIVQRPKDPAAFNGVVICEWANTSTGRDLSLAVHNGFFKAGYAYAAISAQKLGVDGIPGNRETGVVNWDPERYGGLSHPGDAFSYDIFTQVAKALSARAGPAPLAGLKVRHRIATGASQSAVRLVSYINAVHPLAAVFSGFMPLVLVGGGAEFDSLPMIEGETVEAYHRRRSPRITRTIIRDDLDAPVLVLISEMEARGHRVAPQPDSRRLRVWEVAGSVHGSASDAGYRPDTSERDGIRDPFGKADQKMAPFTPTIAAAGLGMVRWIEGGPPLARHPRLLRGSDPRTLALDANGNALGGVRLPELLAPTATFVTATGGAYGQRREFSAETLRALYPTDGHYLNAVKAAVAECELRDLILPYRAAEYVEAARAGLAPAGGG